MACWEVSTRPKNILRPDRFDLTRVGWRASWIVTKGRFPCGEVKVRKGMDHVRIGRLAVICQGEMQAGRVLGQLGFSW